MEKNKQQKQKNTRTGILTQMDNALRRLIDIIFSFLGLMFLSPVFVLIAIAIKRSSPGPVFYWGQRVGKNGKVFKILKFRTMYERKESYAGPKVTAENDPRITPLGRVLRQTKLNELPQLWNVFIGDMSLVGPRPEDPTIISEWPEEVRREIFTVKPGITSPASVVYRNEEDLLQSSSLMDTYLWDILPTKLRLDQIYVRNCSVLTDMDVILWTLIALLPRLNGISVPEHMLYWGPLSRFTSQYLAWFITDFIVSFIAVATAGIIRRLTDPFDLGLDVAVAIALAIALLFSLINTLAGLNRINWAKARTQEALDLAFSTGIVTALVLVANLVFPRGTRFPISVIIVSGMLSYFGFLTVRYRTRMLASFARYWVRIRGRRITPLGERVMIVGAGEVARFAIWLLSNENLAQAFSIVGMVDDDPRKVGTKIDAYTVISTTSAIPELVKKYDVGLILFAIADIQPAEQDRILNLCQTTSARITPIPDIIDNLRAQFPKNEKERDIHFNKVLNNATTDRLTGALNQPHFMRLAESEFGRSQRYHHPLTLLALQIDYERPENTNPSRSVTTNVMQVSARNCLKSIRGIDLLSRFGENRFIMLLPETNEAAGLLVARRLREQITAEPVETNRGQVKVLIQFSLVTNEEDDFHEVGAMVERAIEKLLPLYGKGEAVSVSDSNLH